MAKRVRLFDEQVMAPVTLIKPVELAVIVGLVVREVIGTPKVIPVAPLVVILAPRVIVPDAPVVVRPDKAVVLPTLPPKVILPNVPGFKVSVWAPSMVEVDPEKVIEAPAAVPPALVVSKVTCAPRRELPVTVIIPPPVVMFWPK